MLVKARSLAAIAVVVVVAATLFTLGQPSPLAGSGTLQSGPNFEIRDKECAFWLDYNGDGEGDERLSGEYVIQETSIVGGCVFKLSAPEEVTLVVESDLTEWETDVELKREPGSTKDFKLYPGRNQIPGIQGSMRVVANFVRGTTPRSGKSRTLTDGYRHEVQIPEEFRLLGITVTTPDGKKDRLEQNAQSASRAYISAHKQMGEAELPEWAATLAEEWMAEGYPQVADRVMTIKVPPGDTGIRWWKWGAIGTWVGVLVIVISITAFYLVKEKRNQPEPRRPIDDPL